MDTDAITNANADTGGSTIVLRELCSGELKRTLSPTMNHLNDAMCSAAHSFSLSSISSYLGTQWLFWVKLFFTFKCLQIHDDSEVFPNEPPHEQNQQNDCVPSKDSVQPGHSPSLIRAFAVRMKKADQMPLSISESAG